MAREADFHAESGEARRPGPGPGELLQSERERRDFSAAQVAHELHLSVSLVESLERNDFSPLGAPIFIRGHLKNYARLLGLNPGDVLAAYDRIAEWREPEIDTQQPKGPPVETRSRRWVSVVSWLVVVALLVSLALWGYHRLERVPGPVETTGNAVTPDDGGERPSSEMSGVGGEESTPVDETDSDPAGPIGGADAEDRTGTGGETAADEGDETRGRADEAPPTGATAGEEGGESARPGNEAPASGDDVRSPSEAEPGGATDNTQAGAAPGDRAGFERESGAEPETPDARAGADAGDDKPPVSGPEARLTLRLNGESWVEVYDANNRQLIYRLLRDGAEHRVEGVAPLRVFLGNAPVVEARVNDRPIDISSRIRGDKTAYFVIPAPSQTTDQQ